MKKVKTIIKLNIPAGVARLPSPTAQAIWSIKECEYGEKS